MLHYIVVVHYAVIAKAFHELFLQNCLLFKSVHEDDITTIALFIYFFNLRFELSIFVLSSQSD